jgi:adenylate cyclase
MIPQLEAIASPKLSDWQNHHTPAKSYKEQRQRFFLKRLQLLTQIVLVVGLTMTAFFIWVNSQMEGKLYAFKIGLIIELFGLICWGLCKTPFGFRYPHLIFVSLCWSITCVIQIQIALLFNDLEPRTNIWNLVFLTQAAIVPVLWQMHLLTQVGTLICYLLLYLVYQPHLNQPFAFYVEQGIYLFWTGIISVFSVYLYEKLTKKEFRARQELEISQQQSEKLLLNILPEMIATQLKQSQSTIADNFLAVSVLFADIVGFTELSTRTSPAKLVELLNEIFCLFDELAERHGVEKIKTIGDAYIANMALDMQLALAQFNQANNQSFRIRIGISTGPVVAGVIGLKKFAYDLWGDTVNVASRMESHGIAGSIQVCEASYQLLKEKYFLEKRGLIKVKGKGEMMTYLLQGIKAEQS